MSAAALAAAMDDTTSYNENLDTDYLLGNDAELAEVLRMLGKQPNFRLSKEQASALKDAKLMTFEKAFTTWNHAKAKEDDNVEYGEEDPTELIGLLQNAAIAKAEKGRHPLVNKTVAIAFHVAIIINFAMCLCESYWIIAENAKLELMFLEEMFQCLKIPKNQQSFFHFINIFHAICCVVVLHARTKHTAHLCWAFLLGCSVHTCHRFYEVLFIWRFEYDERVRGYSHLTTTIMSLLVIIQVPSTVIVLLRYYDLTSRFEERAHEFATKTYEGRQLNDKIIYKNVSSFLQRKLVLRSCTALQIFSTVQKIQAQKKRLKKGQTISQEYVEREAQAAVDVLKEVEDIRGEEMLRELKRRQYESLNEGNLLLDKGEFQIGGGGEEEGEEYTGLIDVDKLSLDDEDL